MSTFRRAAIAVVSVFPGQRPLLFQVFVPEEVVENVPHSVSGQNGPQQVDGNVPDEPLPRVVEDVPGHPIVWTVPIPHHGGELDKTAGVDRKLTPYNL